MHEQVANMERRLAEMQEQTAAVWEQVKMTLAREIVRVLIDRIE